jgi:type IV secretory pathway VirB2 component (pilin)
MLLLPIANALAVVGIVIAMLSALEVIASWLVSVGLVLFIVGAALRVESSESL